MGSADKQALAMAAKAPVLAIGPRYDVNRDGVHYIAVKRDRDTGELLEQPPEWLSDKMELLGCGTDADGNHHRIVKWQRQGNGEVMTTALPSADIGERAGWALLRKGGLTLTTDRGGQARLAHWLQREGSTEWHDIVNMSGWQHGAFVLPNGDIIGRPNRKMHFNGRPKDASAYHPAGSLTDWQGTVGALALGNPLAMTTIACALAGPLLALCGARDGIGLHLYTNSSSGKSTCADTAASIWGDPQRTLHTWSGTALGLTNEAEASNDMMIYLDEVGSGDARKIGPAIYSMLNGVSKLQGAKEGGNRAARSWKLTMISTGEVAMSQYLTEGGQTPRGGQEIRLLDIPADTGPYRAFDHIHGRSNGEVFADELTRHARSHYGTVGRAFVAWLQDNRAAAVQWVEQSQQRMLTAVPEGAAPTVRRATRKFAILSAAAEMASHAGLTGWTVEQAIQGVETTWQRWMQAFGIEDRDDARLIDQAAAVLQASQYARFVLLPMNDNDPLVPNLMGYKRYTLDGEAVFLVTPGAFKGEVIAGYEVRHACEVLYRAGMLQRPKGRAGWTVHGGKGVGQVYRMQLQPHDGEAEE